MLKRDVLKNTSGAPRAVRESMGIISLMEIATMGPVSESVLEKTFYSEIQIRNGSDADFEWLVNAGVVTEASRVYWDEAKDLFVELETEDAE
jgi:hypothetical protein